MRLMSGNKRDLHLEKLKGGLDEYEAYKIDSFFSCLDKKIDLPILGKSLLHEHFIHGFEYYLEKGKSVDEITSILSLDNLGSFYNNRSRKAYSLDNAAIIYPLGMKYNQMPMFRLSFELKEEIEPVLLQLALDFTLKRFPTFSAIIKNGFFWHYLESVNNVIAIEEEKDIPCKPISITLRTYKSFRVLYYRKRLSVEYFHAITDGSGGMVFLKTLLSEYLRLKGVSVKKEKGVLDSNGEVDEKELVNEFKNAKGESSFSTFMDKKSVQLTGKLSNLNITRITHFVMESDKLLEKARSYDSTITSYLTALMFMAADKCTKKKGIFNIQIPVNMRKFDGSITLRNYSMYFNACMELGKLPEKEELIKEINRQIKEKGSQSNMYQMVQTTEMLIDSLSFVPLFLKVPIMQNVYGYMSNSIISDTLSNLGVVDLPEGMEEEVEKAYFLLVPGKPNRVASALVTVNGTAVFSIIKNSNDPSFEELLYEYLEKDGILKQVEGSVEYES